MRRRSVVSALLAVLMVLPCARAADDAAGFIARIESAQSPNRQGLDGFTLKELMDRFGVPAVSIAVVRNFEIHWARAYGVSDVESGSAANPETLFQAASISKPVAAMAVLRAAQEGRLSLDADVNKLLKSWKVPSSEHTSKQPVTPRSLLSHSSGSDDGFGFPGYHPKDPVPTPVQILLGEKPSNTGPVLFARPPFAAFKYSGGGVTIMQLALSEALGRPFPEILDATVLRPIGMALSGYEQPLSKERDVNAARAHNGQGKAMDAKWHVYPELAAAGLWTTPSDLARFAIEVQLSLLGRSNKVLARDLVRQMVTPVGVGGYGLGLSVERRGEGWYFGHGGANWGFRCDVTGHFSKGYGVAIMTNSDRGGAVVEELKTRVAAAYGWDSLDKPLLR